MKKAEEKLLKAAIKYCGERDSAVGDNTEQWHQWRDMRPAEQALFAAYRKLKYPKGGKVYN